MSRLVVAVMLLALLPGLGIAAEVVVAATPHANIAYRTGAALDEYTCTRCVLDLYLPEPSPTATKPFPVLLWFHGGGLEGGEKGSAATIAVARRFAAAGIAVAVAEYRLSPTVSAPTYIEDAAAAVAWVAAHIAEYGGDPHAVFISGHSAGGYLAALLGADSRYLTSAGVPPEAIAGIIPVSGQVFTHFTISKERGIPDSQHTPVIDAYAPCYHVAHAKTMPPFLLLCGDHDWPARAEENRYFLAALKTNGATDATYIEVADRDHGSILGRIPRAEDPTALAIIAFVTAHRR